MELLKQNFKNISAICSIKNNQIDENKIYKLSCQDNYKNFSTLKNINSSFLASCPLDCYLYENIKIYGNLIYNEESSICKSAIHSGLLHHSGNQKKKTILHVTPFKTNEFCKGKSQNNIDSKDFYGNTTVDQKSVYNSFFLALPPLNCFKKDFLPIRNSFLKKSFLQIDEDNAEKRDQNSNLMNKEFNLNALNSSQKINKEIQKFLNFEKLFNEETKSLREMNFYINVKEKLNFDLRSLLILKRRIEYQDNFQNYLDKKFLMTLQNENKKLSDLKDKVLHFTEVILPYLKNQTQNAI